MPPSTFCICSLTVVLLLTSHLPITFSQGVPTPTAPPGLEQATAELLNRHAYQSSDAPLTKTLTSSSELQTSYKTLLDYIAYIEGAVVYATNRTSQTLDESPENNDERDDDATLTTCNHRDDGWVRDIIPYFLARGWEPPDTSCVSDVYGTTPRDGVINPGYELSKRTPLAPTELFQAVTFHSHLVNRTAERSATASGIASNWTNPTRARGFEHDVRSQICRYDYTAFVKFDRKWFLAERITNDQWNVVLDVGKRNFLYEYIRPGERPKTMKLRDFGNDTLHEDATTVLGFSTGIVTGSAFGTVFSTDNLAVGDALRLGEHQTQQADDATTSSNIAILAFPLVMNVVPVALIADVNTFGMLVYTILTDILTAVPLAIKGIEVLTIGGHYNTAAVTRMTGANIDLDGPEPAIKAAEVWVAECHAKGSLTGTGVTLLIVALSFMVGGVIGEFWARRWVLRKNVEKLLASSLGGAQGGNPIGGIHGVNGYFSEPVSTSSFPVGLAVGTPPGNATAALLAAGVRERDRFHGLVNAGVVPGTGTAGPAHLTPPTSENSEGYGMKAKEK